MQFVKLAARVFDTPLMVHRPYLSPIAEFLDARIAGGDLPDPEAALSFRDSFEPEEADPVDDIAVIPIRGSLVHRGLGGLNALSGLRSYLDIGDEFRAALADETIGAIVFDFDSGGGEVSGLFELADEIYEARGTKPIFGFVNDTAASAAYVLASAVDPGRLFVGKSSLTGSIGIIMVHRNQEAADRKKGLEYTEVFAGARKADGSPHKNLEGESKAAIQGMIDTMYGVMIDTIARNRGVDAQEIRDTEAGILVGMDAVEKGLADEASSLREVMVMAFDAQIERSNAEMDKGNKTITAEAGAQEPKPDLKLIRSEAKAEALKEERDRVSLIRGLSFAGAEGIIEAAIDKGENVEDTKTNLITFVQKEGLAKGYLAARQEDDKAMPEVPAAEENVIPAKTEPKADLSTLEGRAKAAWDKNEANAEGEKLQAEFNNDFDLYKIHVNEEEKQER